MNYAIRHTTCYRYSGSVASCHNEARLLPRDTPWQVCGDSQIAITPKPSLQSERLDFFGNRVLYFAVQDIHHELEVTIRTRIATGPRPLTPQTPSPAWEEVARIIRELPELSAMEARLYTLDSPFIRRDTTLAQYAQASFPAGRPLIEAALDLTRRIFREFTYDPHYTTLATPLHEVLESRRGVCQDFAHLAIGCLRSLGLAARYVSGYLETLPPPGQEKLIGADASHAWLAVYVPGLGWAEFDPTNDCMPGERHVILAWGRDYADVPPLKGVMSGGGAHTLEVAVDVNSLTP